MLVILPPSESKRPPRDGDPPLDLGELSFPELTPVREGILAALIATSARPDALRRLHAGPSLGAEVARNTALRTASTAAAVDVYAGDLYQALDPSGLSAAATRRAATETVIVSTLFGVVRPVDEIPAYRCSVHSRLVGLDGLVPTWRTVLPEVLAGAAGRRGVLVDLRSPAFQALGMAGGVADRTVVTRVVRDTDGSGKIGDVIAKRTRGLLARHLLETTEDPDHPAALATIVADRWAVELESLPRNGRPWTLTITVPA